MICSFHCFYLYKKILESTKHTKNSLPRIQIMGKVLPYIRYHYIFSHHINKTFETCVAKVSNWKRKLSSTKEATFGLVCVLCQYILLCFPIPSNFIYNIFDVVFIYTILSKSPKMGGNNTWQEIGLKSFFQLKHLRRNFYLVLYTFATSLF